MPLLPPRCAAHEDPQILCVAGTECSISRCLPASPPLPPPRRAFPSSNTGETRGLDDLVFLQGKVRTQGRQILHHAPNLKGIVQDEMALFGKRKEAVGRETGGGTVVMIGARCPCGFAFGLHSPPTTRGEAGLWNFDPLTLRHLHRAMARQAAGHGSKP